MVKVEKDVFLSSATLWSLLLVAVDSSKTRETLFFLYFLTIFLLSFPVCARLCLPFELITYLHNNQTAAGSSQASFSFNFRKKLHP